MISKILKEIDNFRDPDRVRVLSNFFKTDKGQYGEGDIFLGLTVPISRKIALKYKDISISDILFLLKNKIHEVRLVGLLILVYQYKHIESKQKEDNINCYLKNTKYVNNWDLVDQSAYNLLGDYLVHNKRINILMKLVNSKSLWEQRIAIVSTYAFIKKGNIKWTMKIAKKFLNNEHDLIHKATGWMLREAGKRNLEELLKFLDKNLSKIPRTMLRYAIEKFPENLRQKYLKRY